VSNLDSQDIDGLPFIEALIKTVDKKWGGILRVMKNDEQIGSVFMRDGQVAWAVSNNQTENFGSFLERIGLIPKEKLNEIAIKYRALGKSKKLGTLLEEEGLISRTKLRECLRAHIRAAIASMMDDPEVVIAASHGEMIVDTNLMFLLNEVLPGHYLAGETSEARPVDRSEADDAQFVEPGEVNDAQPVEPGEANDAQPVDVSPEEFLNEAAAPGHVLVDILGNLATLPGYRFSLLSGTDGKLLALHKANADMEVAETADLAVAWINSSAMTAANGPFGKLECLTLEHEDGLLIAQWTDNERQFFVGGSFDKNGKLGVIKHKVSEIIPSISQFISESNG
jgi:hypothetical protein